ncbi:MAG: hypothetical protein R2748_07595 [Bryobacterales bacterium]
MLEPDGARPEQVVLDAETETVLYSRDLVQQAEPDGYVFSAGWSRVQLKAPTRSSS